MNYKFKIGDKVEFSSLEAKLAFEKACHGYRYKYPLTIRSRSFFENEPAYFFGISLPFGAFEYQLRRASPKQLNLFENKETLV